MITVIPTVDSAPQPEWQKWNSSSTCCNCTANIYFTYSHCRKCGSLICSSCSSKRGNFKCIPEFGFLSDCHLVCRACSVVLDDRMKLEWKKQFDQSCRSLESTSSNNSNNNITSALPAFLSSLYMILSNDCF
jgi:hypothetical protein